MGHAVHPAPLTSRDVVLLAALLLTVIALFLSASYARARRARAAVGRALGDAGYEVVQLNYRWFSFGSGLGLPGRGQLTYRFIARDMNARERTGWARWGRVWVLDPDRLELRWDDERAQSI